MKDDDDDDADEAEEDSAEGDGARSGAAAVAGHDVAQARPQPEGLVAQGGNALDDEYLIAALDDPEGGDAESLLKVSGPLANNMRKGNGPKAAETLSKELLHCHTYIVQTELLVSECAAPGKMVRFSPMVCLCLDEEQPVRAAVFINVVHRGETTSDEVVTVKDLKNRLHWLQGVGGSQIKKLAVDNCNGDAWLAAAASKNAKLDRRSIMTAASKASVFTTMTTTTTASDAERLREELGRAENEIASQAGQYVADCTQEAERQVEVMRSEMAKLKKRNRRLQSVHSVHHQHLHTEMHDLQKLEANVAQKARDDLTTCWGELRDMAEANYVEQATATYQSRVAYEAREAEARCAARLREELSEASTDHQENENSRSTEQKLIRQAARRLADTKAELAEARDRLDTEASRAQRATERLKKCMSVKVIQDPSPGGLARPAAEGPGSALSPRSPLSPGSGLGGLGGPERSRSLRSTATTATTAEGPGAEARAEADDLLRSLAEGFDEVLDKVDSMHSDLSRRKLGAALRG